MIRVKNHNWLNAIGAVKEVTLLGIAIRRLKKSNVCFVWANTITPSAQINCATGATKQDTYHKYS